MSPVLPALVFSVAATVGGGSDRCRDAMSAYNDMVVAIHAAARNYERCVTSSLGRDDCGAEYIELQVAQRDFEAAVDERAVRCLRR